MKNRIATKLIAWILTLLMLAGAVPALTLGAFAAEAIPPGTYEAALKINKQPKDLSFIVGLNNGWPALDGLNVTISYKSFSKTIDYDSTSDGYFSNKDGSGDIGLGNGYYDWVVGDNVAYVYVNYCSNDGKYTYSAHAEITMKGISVLSKFDPAKAPVLKEGEAAQVSLKAPKSRGDQLKLFSFTPAKSGYYSFLSSDDKNCDPYGVLFDAKGNMLRQNDDRAVYIIPEGMDPAYVYDPDLYYDDWFYDEWNYYNPYYTYWAGGLNFGICYELKAGKTYYLLAMDNWLEAASFKVTVAPSSFQAPAELKTTFHKSVGLEALAQNCTYDVLVLDSSDVSNGWFNLAYNYFAGSQRGSQAVTLSTPDGKQSQQVKLSVDYDFGQWLAVIFAFGWAWLDQTEYDIPEYYWW